MTNTKASLLFICCFYDSELISVLVSYIIQLDSAETDEDIDSLLQQGKFMCIINTSGWSITTPINMSTKASLLQGLIWDEVVGKREQQLRAFRKGLENFGIMRLVEDHPDLAEELFVFKNIQMTANDFKLLISSLPPNADTNPKHGQVYHWFLQYIEERAKQPQGTNTIT